MTDKKNSTQKSVASSGIPDLSKLFEASETKLEKPAKKLTSKQLMNRKYEEKRNQYWPALGDVDPQKDRILWESANNKGFVKIPKALPMILNIMDYLSPKPVSATYLALWCRTYGTGFVEIKDLDSLAVEAGFTGTRATGTLNSRIKLLSDETDSSLGFIRTVKSSSGKYKTILMLNPMLIIYLKYLDGVVKKEVFDDLFARCVDLGDKDFSKFDQCNIESYRSFLSKLS